MRILVSALFLYPGRVGGVESYFLNLLKGLKSLNLSKNFTILIREDIDDDYINNSTLRDYKILKLKIRGNRVVYDLFLGYFVDLSEYDLLFSPNYVTPLNSAIPVVTVIHDLQYKHFPEFFSLKKRLWLHFSHKVSLAKAAKIVAISNFVKRDIIKHYGTRYENKVIVIYNPIDISKFDVTKMDNLVLSGAKKLVNSKFILTVAAQYPHKNLMTLIRAYNMLPTKVQNEYKLVLVGQLGDNLIGNYSIYYRKLLKLVRENKNIFLAGYISDVYLGYLYRNCKVFVFPSLFEGFGMPVVESMIFGKPTIVSDIPIMREVTMNKAIYVRKPQEPKSWCETLLRVIENYNFYSKFFRSNANLLRNIYTIDVLAKRYADLFREVIGASEKKSD